MKQFRQHIGFALSLACRAFSTCFSGPIGPSCGLSAALVGRISEYIYLLALSYMLAGVSQSCVGHALLEKDSDDPTTQIEILTRSDKSFEGLYDVYVFNNNALGRIDTYQNLYIESGNFHVAYTGTDKIAAAIKGEAWSRAYSDIPARSFSQLEQRSLHFQDESPSMPTVSGLYRWGDPYMELTPLLSRVTLRNIRADFSSRPFLGEVILSPRVFLTNVSNSCEPFRFEDFKAIDIINLGGFQEKDIAKLRYPQMLWASLGKQIGASALHADIQLYCYPNTNVKKSLGSPFTTLVIEGVINGQTRYWPIEINRGHFSPILLTPGIDRGVNYVFDITILGAGVSSPEEDLSPQDISVSCSIIPWNEKNGTIEKY